MTKGKDAKGKHGKSKSKASGSVTNGKSSSGPSNQKMTPKCKKLPKGKLALPTPKDAGKAKRVVQPSKTGKSKSKAHKIKSSAKTTKSSLKSDKSSTKPPRKNLKGKSVQKEKSILKTKSLTKAKPLKTKSSLGAASSLKGKQVSKTKSSKTKSNFKINSTAKVRSSMLSKTNAEKSSSKSSKSGQRANKDENITTSKPSMGDIKAKLSKTGIKSPEIPSKVSHTAVDVQPKTKSPIKTNEENVTKSAVEAPVKTGTPPSGPRKMKMKRKKVTAKSMGKSEGSGSSKKSAGKEAPEGLLNDKSNYQDTIDAVAKSAVIEAAKHEEPKPNQLEPEKLLEEKTKEKIKETEIESKKSESSFGKQVPLKEGVVGTTEPALAAVHAASPPQVSSPANQPDNEDWEYSWEEVEIPTYEYVYEYDLVDEKDLHKYNPKELMLMEEPREDAPKKAPSTTTKDQIETSGKANNSELKLDSGSPKSPIQNVAIVNEMTAKDKDTAMSPGAVSGQSEAVEPTDKTASKEKSKSFKGVIETSVPDDAKNASPLDAKASHEAGVSDGHTPIEGLTMAPVGPPKSPSSKEKAAQIKSPPMSNDSSQTPSKVTSAHILAQCPPTSLTLEPSQVPNKESHPGEAAEAITVQVNPVSDASVLEKVLKKESPSSSLPGNANEPKCLANGKATSLQKTGASSSFEKTCEQPEKQPEVSLSIKSPPSTTGDTSDKSPKSEVTPNDPFPKVTDIKSPSEGNGVSKSSTQGEKDKGRVSLVKMNNLQSSEKVLSPPSVSKSPSGSGKIKLQVKDEPKSVEVKEEPKPTDTLPSGQMSEAKMPTKETSATIKSPPAQAMAPNPSAGCKMVSPPKAPETGELAKENVESSTSPASSVQENRHESKKSN